MKRILFFAEAVTLAHVARLIVLADALDRSEFEPIFACHPFYHRFFQGKNWTIHPLQSISTEQFLRSLSRGNAVYDVATLRRYVAEDMALMQTLNPDLVVGDFRISLSVSARLAGIPYITITNAYWSPYSVCQELPLPELPLTRILPIGIAARLFRAAKPLAMKIHCGPLNQVRREHGLPSLGNHLGRVYSDADAVLYADLPSLFPTHELPPSHRFIGPILWSPPVTKPEWWDGLPDDRPVVYVTLGSSGKRSAFNSVVHALAKLPITVIASTAGGSPPESPSRNLYSSDYLPGTEAAARSSLVVCNGGSMASQQALAAGVPVLGVVSNADQFMNAGALKAAGCGALLRADRLSDASIQSAALGLLRSPRAHHVAQVMKRQFAALDSKRSFVDLAARMCR